MTEPRVSHVKPIIRMTDLMRELLDDAHEAGKQEGRKEVVDWLEGEWENTPWEEVKTGSPIIQIQVSKSVWRAFLKDNGLERE